MSIDSLLDQRLDALKQEGQFRDPRDAEARDRVERRARELGVPLLDLSSNDYLGLAHGGRNERALERKPTSSVSRETPRSGAGASRLVQGTHPEHERLERELADWVDLPAALLFSSGFAANLGALGAVLDRESVVVSDALNHASLIDGCRLARAQTRIVPHCDLAAIEACLSKSRGVQACWVVTESTFSMDGDQAPLRQLRELCDRYQGFLVVDEAHALGVFGPEGGGLCRESGVRPDVLIGGLGKAVGAQGGFVAGSPTLRTFLWNRARSFVFSTAPSPRLTALTRRQVRRARSDDAARSRIGNLSQHLRAALRAQGWPVPSESRGPIIPLWVGSGAAALALTERLRHAGILVQAIRPPTVPPGSERVRLTLNAGLNPEDLERLIEVLASSRQAAVEAGGR